MHFPEGLENTPGNQKNGYLESKADSVLKKNMGVKF